MSDEPTADVSSLPPTPGPVHPQAISADYERLDRSVRGLRIWLIVLSVAIVLLFLCSCAVVSSTVFGFGGLMMSMDMSVPDEQVEQVTQEVEDAFGDRLEHLDVRAVRVNYGEPAWLSGMPAEEVLYVEYRLRGIDVTVASAASTYGPELLTAGIVPTRGSLSSRMTDEQFEAILEAYGEQTRSPFGPVRRYSDADPYAYEPTTPKDTIVVAGEEYATATLWAVTEGELVDGDSLDRSGMGPTGKAYIFFEDSEAGTFEFLGTEALEMYW
ncbi:MAG: hypothetical protein U1E29_17870 [Coriobacteriia bacterium]|nr:hypothetical protein [Coriobacteriia bacterium]